VDFGEVSYVCVLVYCCLLVHMYIRYVVIYTQDVGLPSTELVVLS
jgi:hypothetical protein